MGLKVFEGMPFPYSHKQRRVIPQAMKCLRMKNGRKHTRLGDLSASVGWNRSKILASLEEKRKSRSATYHARKMKLQAAVKKTAMNQPEVKKLRAALEKLGY